MPYTFGQLKSALRETTWPAGEPPNLVKAHDKTILDAIIEIQTWVKCQQQDNTSLFPHCSTLYNCGLTVIDEAPRGIILKVSVIDKINPDTHLEDPDADDDWCARIYYNQVDACHIHSYYRSTRRFGCCPSIPLFFGIGAGQCSKAAYPVPTDAGLPGGLPGLPLGFHYAQDSTNRTRGRAQSGVWAQERGQIWIAPWIQGTETVVVEWDGIKRTWSDADPIDSDPLLLRAIKAYVQREHAEEFDHDAQDAGTFEAKWTNALGMLIHQCREETRQRDCETSHARGSVVTNLYYNDEQSATAQCPDGQDGSPVTVTIPAGSVGSNVSVSDANQKAQAQALEQATAQLNCSTPETTYPNDAQTATVSCSAQNDDAPPPDGQPVTVTIPAGAVTSTVSKADANAQALAQAQAAASAQLSCTFWNTLQTYTAACIAPSVGSSVTKTKAAHTYSSHISQADADAQALNAAKLEAESALVCSSSSTFFNSQQQAGATKSGCRSSETGQICSFTAIVVVAANTFSSVISQADANLRAAQYAAIRAQQEAAIRCRSGECGGNTINFP